METLLDSVNVSGIRVTVEIGIALDGFGYG